MFTNKSSFGYCKKKLSKAKRNISKFRSTLITKNHNKKYFRVFENVLQTPGCSKFVKELLRAGYNPNYINRCCKKAAINYVTDSQDPDNLKELLALPGIDVDYKYSELTPLNLLAKRLNNKNADNIIKCMNILLQYGASPNVCDSSKMTPLWYVVKNNNINKEIKYRIIEIFLSLNDIKMDALLEAELKILFARLDDKLTFDFLLSYIESGQMELFKQLYTAKEGYMKKEEKLQLLVESIERECHKAFDLILDSGLDCNCITSDNTNLLQIARFYGNSHALKKLLQQSNIVIHADDQLLIHVVVKLCDKTLLDSANYWQCFYILLDSSKIDINDTDPDNKYTALHYAAKYGNKKAVKELLKRGACISLENQEQELALYYISPSLFEEHLDDCISSSDHKLDDKNYEIILDYKNFLTSSQKINKEMDDYLLPILFFTRYQDYHYLLQHPIITTLLIFKWHKHLQVFFTNFALSGLLTVTMFTRICVKFCELDNECLKEVSMLFSDIAMLGFSARECLQLIFAPITYLKSFTNYLEILLIIVSVMTCADNMDFEVQRNAAICCIMLLNYELVSLVSCIPNTFICTNLQMLKAVFKTFFRSFLIYSFFLFSYTLCFYLKYGNVTDKNIAENSTEKDFNRFSNPLGAFTKTIVMFTGEFDAGNLELDTIFAYLLFLSFVLFSIILYNLLNGLAVSDIQAIRDEAKFNDIIARIDVLSRYGKLAKKRPFLRPLDHFFKSLRIDLTIYGQISILPNKKNTVPFKKLPDVNDMESAQTIMISRMKSNDKEEKYSITKLLNYIYSLENLKLNEHLK
ncbi:transient receptor potential cation channel protein painless-like [Lucilia sericata]|uniref:transient receptor potential cation channel protein painless-like n=1 Tax=Lucilia sericata TaxID=13632 RepID=UPI0018A861B0|nr:transient receptor potential cation channel protein painless-like [Lucilia sericata]